jgi:hypothetical protein
MGIMAARGVVNGFPHTCTLVVRPLAGSGLNSILGAQDAFFASWITNQYSGHPNAEHAARIRGGVDRRESDRPCYGSVSER